MPQVRGDSLDLGAATSRPRLFVCGIHKSALRGWRGAGGFHQLFSSLVMPRGHGDAVKLIDNDSPEVLAEQKRLFDVALRSRQSGGHQPPKALPKPFSRRSIKKVIANAPAGAGAPVELVWEREHKELREAWPDCPPFPSPAVRQQSFQEWLGRGEDGHTSYAPWPCLYSLREHDMSNILTAWAAGQSFFFDISEPLSHRRMLAPQMLPCILPTHRLFSTEQQRHLLGVESLMTMGYPDAIRPGLLSFYALSQPCQIVCLFHCSLLREPLQQMNISDVQLRKMAGKSISIPMCQAVLLCQMSFCDFSIVLGPQPAGQLPAGAEISEEDAAKRLLEVCPHIYTNP